VEVYFIKIEKGIVPACDSDYDAMKRFKNGEPIKAIITKPRNYEFHKKFFALIRCIHHNLPESWGKCSENSFRKVITMRAGFFNVVKTDRGEWQEPVSISFANMDNLEFEEVYNKVLDECLKIIPFDRQDLEKELIEFM